MGRVAGPAPVPPNKRIWVKHKNNGAIGWLVRHGGTVKVKLDREDPWALRPYSDKHWEPLKRVKKVHRMALALVQWRADRELLRAVGELKLATEAWDKMPVPERVEFMDEGPKSGPHLERRQRLWRSIKEVTDAFANGVEEE
jgi:hypothetical protein